MPPSRPSCNYRTSARGSERALHSRPDEPMPSNDEKDPYNLHRFVEAQNPVYEQACSELRRGQKSGHWMWFIFPQIAGLGSSSTARFYAISSLTEAQAYLHHSILGPRLEECCGIVNGVEGHSADEIFGYPDTLKFRSSLTLFARAAGENSVFHKTLDKYFHGEFDPLTLERL